MSGSSPAVDKIAAHIERLKQCTLCPNMIGPVVVPRPVVSKVYLVGQAPGPREGAMGRPFAWTAGKTLFKWFEQIGLNEEQFRSLTYMSAVCRCFPGKAKGGGDRVPSRDEIVNCYRWMKDELDLLRPGLIIPVGRLAIEQFLPSSPLNELIGRQFHRSVDGIECNIIPLPHPSGASTWFKREPGITLLAQGLAQIAKHPHWQELISSQATVNN